tara:strand:+ start:287 stop:487 length:201 start_codon:yes stop_codon:yes gene_type:complete
MKKFNNNKSILFWITGLSGSGKTVIAEKIKHKIAHKYGKKAVFVRTRASIPFLPSKFPRFDEYKCE